MKTNAIILAIVVGISQGTQPIIGFNYGAGQYHRVREAYMLAVKWNLVVSTIAFIAFQFFPQSIISLFGDGDELYFEFAVYAGAAGNAGKNIHVQIRTSHSLQCLCALGLND